MEFNSGRFCSSLQKPHFLRGLELGAELGAKLLGFNSNEGRKVKLLFAKGQ